MKETQDKELNNQLNESNIQEILKIILDISAKLKQIEEKYEEMSSKLKVSYQIAKVSDTSIDSEIEQLGKKIEQSNQKVEQQLISKMQDEQTAIIREYSDVQKNEFYQIIDEYIRNLIKKSKIERLEQEEEYVENEKLSLFDKMMGKSKLKQARLENISLRKQNVENDVQKISNEEYILEDSLSDLYVYIEELGSNLPEDIKEFVQNVKQMPEEINADKLMEYQKQKTKINSANWKLVLVNGKKLSARQEAARLEGTNDELRKKLQNARATTLKKQNMKTEDIKNKAEKILIKFQEIIDEMNLSIKIEENEQEIVEK